MGGQTSIERTVPTATMRSGATGVALLRGETASVLGERLPAPDIAAQFVDGRWDRSSVDLAPAESSAPRRQPRSARTAHLRTYLFLADAAMIWLGAGLAFLVRSVLRPDIEAHLAPHVLLFAVSFPIWILGLLSNRLYTARVVERATEELRRIWAATAAGVAGVVMIAFTFQFDGLSRFWMLASFGTIGTLLSLERWGARSIFRRLRQAGRITRRVAVIGSGAHATNLVDAMQKEPALGYTVVGCIGTRESEAADSCSWLGDIEHAERLLGEHECVGAMISLASVPPDDVNRLTRQLTDRGFHVALSSSLCDISMARIRPQSIDGRTLLYIEPTVRDGWRAFAKRTFDIAVSVVAIMLTLPLMLVAAVAVKATSPGPVFFRQERVGAGGNNFRMTKFRTMAADAESRRDALAHANESDGPLFKIADDPRVTTVGRFLRKWSIDEIPQFFNVLRGHMSVVGPRPALPHEADAWDDEVRERLRVLPGITGLWQVAGRADTTFDVYKRLDLFYVDNWSLLHDVHIVMRTFSAVALKRGAK